MDASNFSLEFGLNADEIQKLNKMYFKNLYEERIRFFCGVVLLFSVFYDFYDFNDDSDFIIWIIRNLIFVIVFLIFQYSFVNTICKITFQLIKKLLAYDRFVLKYKFNFTNSFIYVHSPLGEFAHKWTQIEKAILTKDFFFLYIKERNGYIISISNKNHKRNMSELIAYIESNVIQVMKV
ncbi:hypothetical protein D3C86_1175490 [compost metagenome]